MCLPLDLNRSEFLYPRDISYQVWSSELLKHLFYRYIFHKTCNIRFFTCLNIIGPCELNSANNFKGQLTSFSISLINTCTNKHTACYKQSLCYGLIVYLNKYLSMLYNWHQHLIFILILLHNIISSCKYI